MFAFSKTIYSIRFWKFNPFLWQSHQTDMAFFLHESLQYLLERYGKPLMLIIYLISFQKTLKTFIKRHFFICFGGLWHTQNGSFSIWINFFHMNHYLLERYEVFVVNYLPDSLQTFTKDTLFTFYTNFWPQIWATILPKCSVSFTWITLILSRIYMCENLPSLIFSLFISKNRKLGVFFHFLAFLNPKFKDIINPYICWKTAIFQ